MIINESDGGKPTKRKRLLKPLPFNGEFHLTQAFGENPFLYRHLGLPGHNGLDWGMPEGEKVLAVDDGFVIRVDERPDGFGKHIKVQHEWGQTLYAHLSQFAVVLNQPVKQGDIIGLSGNTGFSTGPHLHFGMRVNPYKKNDGWYGYTNPQRYLQWPEAGVIATASPTLATGEDVGMLAFQLQEAQMQGDLWEEKIIELLNRYLPGQLPDDTDAMAVLENLLASWDVELRNMRRETFAGLFGPDR
jgi:hypothetical protein